jgi:hypothetical protein
MCFGRAMAQLDSFAKTGEEFRWGTRRPVLMSLLGANFDPQGRSWPSGVTFVLSSKLKRVFPPRGERKGELCPPGGMFTHEGQVHP